MRSSWHPSSRKEGFDFFLKKGCLGMCHEDVAKISKRIKICGDVFYAVEDLTE